MNAPLRIHVISDLHVEHGGFFAPNVPCDLVIIAGDLANGRSMSKALFHLGKQLEAPAVYVPGNHDWYQTDMAKERSSLVRPGSRPRPSGSSMTRSGT